MEDPALALRNLLADQWDETNALDQRLSKDAMHFDTAKLIKDFRYPSIYVTLPSVSYTILDMNASAIRRAYRADGYLFMNLRARPTLISKRDFGEWKGLMWDMEEETVRILRRYASSAEDIAFLWNFRFMNRDDLEVSPPMLREETTVNFRFCKVD